MESTEAIEVGSMRSSGAVKFVDLRGLDKESAGWIAAYLVYDGKGRAGIIEVEQATEFFKFTPSKPKPGMPPLGDFSVDMLKRRVADWLASESANRGI